MKKSKKWFGVLAIFGCYLVGSGYVAQLQPEAVKIITALKREIGSMTQERDCLKIQLSTEIDKKNNLIKYIENQKSFEKWVNEYHLPYLASCGTMPNRYTTNISHLQRVRDNFISLYYEMKYIPKDVSLGSFVGICMKWSVEETWLNANPNPHKNDNNTIDYYMTQINAPTEKALLKEVWGKYWGINEAELYKRDDNVLYACRLLAIFFDDKQKRGQVWRHNGYSKDIYRGQHWYDMAGKYMPIPKVI